MQTRVVEQLGAFAASWDQLVDQMPLPSPFLRSWWLAHVAVGLPQFVLVVDGDQLVGGLALQQSSLAGVERLEMLGSGPLEPDHLDLVCSPERHHEVTEALRAWLGRPGNRVIDLIGVRAGARLIDVVPGVGEITNLEVAPYVVLPATPAEYLASRHGTMRSTITRTTKRLTKAGITVRVATIADSDRALDALHELHDGRWGDESGFLDSWSQFSAAARAGIACGELRCTELVDSDGAIVAIEVDFVVGGRTSFYQAGRRTDHELRGSGSMLRFEIVSRAIAEGGREFDLLRGAESYKADWASNRRGLIRIRRGVGPRGVLTVAVARANVAVQQWRSERSKQDRAEPGSGVGSGAGPGGGAELSGARVVFYSDAAQIGGAESVAKNLLRELDPRFAVVVVGTTAHVVADIAAVRPAASTMVLPPINDRSDVSAMVAHRRAFAALRPDIFHANLGEGSACQYALLAALSVRGIKIVVTENSPMGVRSELSRRIKRWSAPRFDAHIAVGVAAAALVEADIGLAAGSVEVIPNGVPILDHHPPDRVVVGLVVGAVSRFDPVKGLDVLIEAIARIDDVHLEIIGDGPERPALEALIESLGVGDRVHLKGWVPEARHELPNFDLVVLPSRLEGMPMVLIEAMQAGVATIATDVGSVREVVEDGVTGLVVPPDDVEALASAVSALLGDDETRSALASAGQQVALERFTSAANVADYEAVYDRVLSAASSSIPADRGARAG